MLFVCELFYIVPELELNAIEDRLKRWQGKFNFSRMRIFDVKWLSSLLLKTALPKEANLLKMTGSFGIGKFCSVQ